MKSFSSSSSGVRTMSRGFLYGPGSNKVPLLLLADVGFFFASTLLSWEHRLPSVPPLESSEICSSSAKCSPSSWMRSLVSPEAEGRVSTFSAAKLRVLVGSRGMGEAADVGWGSGGLSLKVFPPPPPLPDSAHSSASDSSLS